MNVNFFWATEKAAPVARSGFGIIPDNLFYGTTTRKIVSILRTDPFMGERSMSFPAREFSRGRRTILLRRDVGDDVRRL
jgi:hypothetical protein